MSRHTHSILCCHGCCGSLKPLNSSHTCYKCYKKTYFKAEVTRGARWLFTNLSYNVAALMKQPYGVKDDLKEP